jgi:hypothetical protein
MHPTPARQINSPIASFDRRTQTRYRLSVPISVHTAAGPPIPAITLEISDDGLSAILSVPVHVGDTVQLEGIAVDMVSAQVRRQIGRVYGFEFPQLTREQASKIQNDCRRLPLYPSNRTGI